MLSSESLSWREGSTVVRRSRRAVLLFVLSLLAPAAVHGDPQGGEALLPGESREHTIAAGEVHTYRVVMMDLPVLLAVEQQGINLIVEAQGPAARFATDTGNFRWGTEVLLLEGAGPYRIEIRSRRQFAAPGRYTIRAEGLASSSAEDEQRRTALSLMIRAGQAAFANTPEGWQGAVAIYREALVAWRSLGDRRWEAETLSALAGLEHDVKELGPAIEHHRLAQALWQELAEPRREAAILSRLGVNYLSKGDLSSAHKAFQDAFSLWQRHGGCADEAEALSNLCFVEQARRDLASALTCYQEPLAVLSSLGDLHHVARIFNNLGGIYDDQGEPDAALEHYQEALFLRRQLEERNEEAETLNNIGVIHRVLGNWQEALRVYGQAREILTPSGGSEKPSRLLASVTQNLGVAYNSLGKPQLALSFLQDALQQFREIGDKGMQFTILNNLGATWLQLEDLPRALDSHQQAFDLATALGDRQLVALSRVRIGEVRVEQGEVSAALQEVDPALPVYLRESGLRRGELRALQLRGRALAEAGRPGEALPVLVEVLQRQRTLRNRAGEAQALHAVAAAERSLGLQDKARLHAEEAVALVEELRTGFVSPDLRAAFLATQRRAYSLLIDLLMDQHSAEREAGYDRKAFQVSERARARSLLDVLYSGDSMRTGSNLPAELLDLRQSLRHRLSAKIEQQLRQGGPGDEKTKKRGQEIDALLAKLDSTEAEIQRREPHYAAVSEPRPLSGQDVAELLDQDTLLLEYSLGENRSYLWAVGKDSLHSFVLPPQREIETLARRLSDELGRVEVGAARRTGTAEALSSLLLGQVWPEVAGHRRLIVVPDAALHLLPFSALPAPGSGQLLLDQLEIAYLPSATTLALQRQRLEHRPPAAKWAAILADPVYQRDDPRLAGQPIASRQAMSTPPQRGGEADAPQPVFDRLFSSREEAAAIARFAPDGQVWTALDLDANREVVLSGGLRDYRYIHFATHGVADTRTPELSSLVLSLVDAAGRPRDGFLSLSDIYELDLNADLVVLSACQTAYGREVRGEGMMGLTRGFLHVGVPRVVASLWRVEDRATEILMTHFYRALWQEGLPPAAALREAQRSLRGLSRYRNHHYWAGFVLQGDWR